MSLLTEPALKTYGFTLLLAGESEMTDELQGRLLAAGCDDASLWSEAGSVYLSFDRQAASLGKAIGSAVEDVERAGLGVARVEVDTPAAA
jgi:hypothetical protein